MAPKMTEVYAVADATVSWVGSRCCSVFLQHDDGWWSWYIHLNNDTPGTDDGLAWGIAEGIVPGARVTAGQLIGWVGDSGNAEDTDPHLHFELHDAYAVKVDPYPSLLLAQTGVGGVCARSEAAPLADLLEAGVTLQKGMQGAAVYELQGFLATRGYQVGSIDGIFGERTYRALRAFQRSQAIKIDGIVGSETRAVIVAFTQRKALASLLDLDGRLLTSGMRGPEVGELKRWLRAVGYDPGPRPFNGVFDALTVSALGSFQQAAGLPADRHGGLRHAGGAARGPMACAPRRLRVTGRGPARSRVGLPDSALSLNWRRILVMDRVLRLERVRNARELGGPPHGGRAAGRRRPSFPLGVAARDERRGPPGAGVQGRAHRGRPALPLRATAAVLRMAGRP